MKHQIEKAVTNPGGSLLLYFGMTSEIQHYGVIFHVREKKSKKREEISE